MAAFMGFPAAIFTPVNTAVNKTRNTSSSNFMLLSLAWLVSVQTLYGLLTSLSTAHFNLVLSSKLSCSGVVQCFCSSNASLCQVQHTVTCFAFNVYAPGSAVFVRAFKRVHFKVLFKHLRNCHFPGAFTVVVCAVASAHASCLAAVCTYCVCQCQHSVCPFACLL